MMYPFLCLWPGKATPPPRRFESIASDARFRLRSFDRYFAGQICIRFIAHVKPKNNETWQID
jgi:hypothetical protein